MSRKRTRNDFSGWSVSKMPKTSHNTFLQNLRRPQTTSRPIVITRKNDGELKGMDTKIHGVEVTDLLTNNNGCFALNLIQQGAGSWNRVGRKVNLNSLRIRGYAMHNYEDSEQGIAGNILRMVVIWDRQPNSSSLPTWDTIFGSTSQDGTETSGVFDSLRYDNTGRFRILKDKTIDMIAHLDNTSHTPGRVFQPYHFDEFINLKKRETLFSGQSDPMTNADISSGSLYVYFKCQRNTLTNYITIQGTQCRLRYYDS